MNSTPVLLAEVALVRGGRVMRRWTAAEGESLVIGTAPGCQIRVGSHPDLLPRHATVTLEDGMATLIAEPGGVVYVNGEPVDIALPGASDAVRVGPLKLRVRTLRHVDHPLLNLELPGGKARRVKLREGRFTIGDDQGGLKLRGVGLASRHAVLHVGDTVALTAADGEVIVDGRPVERVVLGRGRVVSIGDIRVSLVSQELPLHKRASPGSGPAATPVPARNRPASSVDDAPAEVREDVPEVPDAAVEPVDDAPAASAEPLDAAPREEEAESEPPAVPRDPSRGTPGPVRAREASPRVAPSVRPPREDVDLRRERSPGPVAPTPPWAGAPPPETHEDDNSDSDVSVGFRREREAALAAEREGYSVPPAVSPPPVVREEPRRFEQGLPNGIVLEVADEEIVADVDLSAAFLQPGAVPASAGGALVADVVVTHLGSLRRTLAVRGSATPIEGVRVEVRGDGVQVGWDEAWSAEHTVPGLSPRPVAEDAILLPRGEAVRVRRGNTEVRVQAATRARAPLAPLITLGVAVGLPAGILVAAGVLLAVGIALAGMAPAGGDLVEARAQEVFAEVRMAAEPKDTPKPKPIKPPDPVELAAEKTPVVSQKAVEEVPPPAPPGPEAGKPAEKTVSDVLARLKGSALRGTGGNLALETTALGSTGGVDIGQRLAGLGTGKVDVERSVSTAGLVTRGGDIAGKVDALTASERGGARGSVTRVVSQVKVEGSLDRASVHRVINAATHKIQGCYERRLVQVGGLSGRLVLDWTVALDGSVKGTRVRADTAGDAELAACVTGVVSGLQFEQPKGGEVTISYPFLFRPSGG